MCTWPGFAVCDNKIYFYNAYSSGLRFCFKVNADTNMRYVHGI